MNTVIRDTAYAARVLLKHPGFAFVAVLTLALGIGANSTIFSIVNAILLRSIPGVVQPAGLVQVGRTNKGQGFDTLSYLNYIDFRDRNEVFSGLAVQNRTQFHVSTGAEPVRVPGQLVSGNYFDVLGVKPAYGRLLTPDDDRVAGDGSVVVISNGLWKRRFGGDASIVGREISLNAHRYTVVGIAPQGFAGTDISDPVDLWVPLTMYRQGDPMVNDFPEDFLTSRYACWLMAFGRLKQGATIAQARSEMSQIASNLEQSYPEANKDTGIALAQGIGLDPQSRVEAAAFTGMLMAVVGLVLLIACANVANLLLARATSREREIGIRLAMGASRGRIIQQLLTESLLLALIGGGCGLFLALWVNDLLLRILPGDYLGFTLDLDLRLDARVCAFTIGLSLLTGIIFGLAPALQASKPDLVPVLKGGGAGRGARQSRLRSALVVAQIALSLVLMIAAGLFIRTLRNTKNIDPGFEPEHVLSARIDIGRQNYSKQQGRLFYQQLIERIEAKPGVQSASLSITTPLGGGAWGTGIRIEGQPVDQPDVGVDYNVIAPRYFETMSMPIVRGRDFTWHDAAESAPVVIVNETLARTLWPDEDAIGKRLSTGGPPNASPLREVIGIARDAKYRTLFESPRKEMFMPILQTYHSEASVQVRAFGNPSQLVATVQHEVNALDRNLPVFKVKTMSEQLDASLTPQSLAAKLIGALGVLALLLAAIGIYGVMSYTVAQRTHEIGVRMALGAQASDVLRLVVAKGLKLAIVGVAIGLGIAYAVTRAVEGFLYGVSSTDPLTFALISLLLTGVALGACLAPARRAVKVDPMVALRYE